MGQNPATSILVNTQLTPLSKVFFSFPPKKCYIKATSSQYQNQGKKPLRASKNHSQNHYQKPSASNPLPHSPLSQTLWEKTIGGTTSQPEPPPCHSAHQHLPLGDPAHASRKKNFLQGFADFFFWGGSVCTYIGPILTFAQENCF